MRSPSPLHIKITKKIRKKLKRTSPHFIQNESFIISVQLCGHHIPTSWSLVTSGADVSIDVENIQSHCVIKMEKNVIESEREKRCIFIFSAFRSVCAHLLVAPSFECVSMNLTLWHLQSFRSLVMSRQHKVHDSKRKCCPVLTWSVESRTNDWNDAALCMIA